MPFQIVGSYIHILKDCLISMKKLKSLLNSQRTAIFILLILNLLQLRYMGHMREKLKHGRKSIIQS